ncbi:hypothetical protein [Corallincola spongiicola]|uniref:DUF2489 domain-containing protein n=1 Tax=Corallincola spongiicola TaxID=2520508 RepID=A0ABY1WPA0_9GAMM|nr:hypothetical protein [Corallincola spongiicola]TAA45904.1 hypothetical protein EXY25_11155 [Corallincola spongiicola]
MLWIVVSFGLFVVLSLYLYTRTEVLKRDLHLSRRQLRQAVGNSHNRDQFCLLLVKEVQQLCLYQLKRQPATDDTPWRLLLLEKLIDVCSEDMQRKTKPSELFIVHEKRGLNAISLEQWPHFIARQPEEFQHLWRQDNGEAFTQCCRMLAQQNAKSDRPASQTIAV